MNGGDPAFPTEIEITEKRPTQFSQSGYEMISHSARRPGFTKREFIAMELLKGILAGSLPQALVVGAPSKSASEWGDDLTIMAVEFTDMLIKTLNKETPNG